MKDFNLEYRRYIIGGVAILIVVVYIIRLFTLQLLSDDYKKNADSNAFLKKIEYPSRGVIWRIVNSRSRAMPSSIRLSDAFFSSSVSDMRISSRERSVFPSWSYRSARRRASRARRHCMKRKRCLRPTSSVDIGSSSS